MNGLRKLAVLLGTALVLTGARVAVAQDLALDAAADGAEAEGDAEAPDEDDDALLFEDDGSSEVADKPGPLSVWLRAGMGLTQRVIELESLTGPVQLDTSLVPAALVGFKARYDNDSWFMDLDVEYQTSLWAEGAQAAPGGVGRAIPIRSHRAHAGLAPGFRFGDADLGVGVAGMLGYGLRSFATVDDLRVPRYTLHGPLARLDLSITFAELVCVFVRPEMQLVWGLDDRLQRLGTLENGGLMLGGEVGIGVGPLPWLWFAARYRQSNASVASPTSSGLTDVERYVLLDARVRYN